MWCGVVYWEVGVVKDKKGIDWTKKDIYEGIDRTDLKPEAEIVKRSFSDVKLIWP